MYSKIIQAGNFLEVWEYDRFIFRPKNIIYEKKRVKKEGEKSVAVIKDVARSIMRLVNSNYKKFKTSFLTLTYKNFTDDIEKLKYDYLLFIKRFRYTVFDNKRVNYLAIPEKTKKGCLHLHSLFFDLPFVENKKLAEIWGNGFVKINRVDDVSNLGAYVSKYLTKDCLAKKYEKLYWSSKELKRPCLKYRQGKIDELEIKNYNKLYETYYKTYTDVNVRYRQFAIC